VHTPGETYDHLSVWIPELRIAFTGDNIYGSFPNLYTLRGTKPRWALDYVESLDRVRSWRPEVLAPSHETPVYGAETVQQRLQRYRDAILYVHDETVRGMNAGTDVFTLMDAIRLPPELDVGEGYGAVAWTVRGIYEGYLGWFGENPATMYAVAPADTYRELIALLDGPVPFWRAPRSSSPRAATPRRCGSRTSSWRAIRRTGRRSRPGWPRSRPSSPRVPTSTSAAGSTPPAAPYYVSSVADAVAAGGRPRTVRARSTARSG
jgi:hypothetical protein